MYHLIHAFSIFIYIKICKNMKPWKQRVSLLVCFQWFCGGWIFSRLKTVLLLLFFLFQNVDLDRTDLIVTQVAVCTVKKKLVTVILGNVCMIVHLDIKCQTASCVRYISNFLCICMCSNYAITIKITKDLQLKQHQMYMHRNCLLKKKSCFN